MFTKKVIIKWQRDSYLVSGPTDREGAQATALAELDEKTTTMVAEGKMSPDAIVGGVESTIKSIRLFTDQAAAEEWVAFNNTFATTYGFVKISSEITSN
jgi:hypothetical protein